MMKAGTAEIRPIALVAISVLLLSFCIQVNWAHVPLSRRFTTTDDLSGRASTSEESALRLFRGALHMHTLYSDGNDTVVGRVSNAEQVGLDFIIITDHSWSEKCMDECKQYTTEGRFLCVMGWECSTKIAHAPSAFVYSKPVSPRGDWSNYFSAVRSQGGFSWVAHPQWQKDTQGQYPFENWNTAMYNISMIEGVEIWNEGSRQCRPDPTVYPAGAIWDNLLSKGYRVWGVSAEDRHAQGGLGRATVIVYAQNLTLPSISQSLRKGRFNSIRTPHLGHYQNFRFHVKTSELSYPGSTATILEDQDVTIHVEYEITWLKQDPTGRVNKVQVIRDGQILYDDSPFKPSINLTITDRPQKPSIYRTWVRDTTGGWAFSNPIFVNPVLPSYYQAKQLILQAEADITRAEDAKLKSPEGKILLQQAKSQLEQARQALNANQFSSAHQYAQKAIDLVKQSHFVEKRYIDTMTAISQADDAIKKAESGGRTQGLQQAKEQLSLAKRSIDEYNYEKAVILANQAKEAADKATAPTFPNWLTDNWLYVATFLAVIAGVVFLARSKRKRS